MRGCIGSGCAPCEPYNPHVFTEILTEEEKRGSVQIFPLEQLEVWFPLDDKNS